MARLEINGRVFEIPNNSIRQLLESQGREDARTGYPIARHDEYHIVPDDSRISDAEIKSELEDVEEIDLNDGRNTIRPTTWH